MAISLENTLGAAGSGAAAGSAAGPYGAVIGAGISAASSIVSDLFGSHSAKKANETNIQLARENNAYNERMWHMNNEYNSPVNQKRLYREAGINPAFVYGSLQGNSTAVQGTTASVNPYQYSGVARSGEQLGLGWLQAQELKLKQKQVRNDTERVDIEHANMQTQKALADSSIALNGQQISNLTKTGQQIDEQTSLLRQQYQQNKDRFDVELKQLNQNLLNSMEQEIGLKIDNQTKDWMLANLYPLQADLLNKQITYQELVCKWYDKIADSQVFANKKADLVQWLISKFGDKMEEKINDFITEKDTTRSYKELTPEEQKEYTFELFKTLQYMRNRGEKPDVKQVAERIKANILKRRKNK